MWCVESVSKLYKEGRIKAIGVSNFYADKLVDFCLNNTIKPAINQVECHPLYARFESQKIAKEYSVILQSWASFGKGSSDVLNNPILVQIAKTHHKSVTQVILRWLIQRGVVVIPKTTHKQRMIENIAVFDFALNEAEMSKIAQLDRGKSLFIDLNDPKSVQSMRNEFQDEDFL
ncbi:aldo/keto reductase [Helicobacter sp. MIT 11-5569]|uniref:aldo/keto reductase n=1 Tax=Helicobacter sp. MIT 11-5569 TaxID=1548151 RepID=UPI0022A6C850|nr:aldo/keto reductase [Helicobacter sp. MIT 11-5569]